MEDKKYTGKQVDPNEITRQYLDSILLEQRILDSDLPDISTEIFGETFASPIMTPAFSHLKALGEGREAGIVEYARAAKQVNALNWIGMETDEDMEKVLAANPKTVRIIKIFADRDLIYSQMKFAEEHGAIAVGIDIDHPYGNDGKYDVVDGYEMRPVSQEELKDFVKAANVPFVVKGVLSVTDAVKAAVCGADAIVVSHHHGRLPSAVPPLLVLPQIVEALAGTDVRIFVDCHIDNGVDAFKALALGADAVSVGRAMMAPLVNEGVEGVVKKLTRMNEELTTVMGYTGCLRPEDAEPSMLWIPGQDF